VDFRHPDRPRLDQAAVWYERYLPLTTPGRAQLTRYELAQLYVYALGNRLRAAVVAADDRGG